jgi:GntR family transcriptional regulator
LEASVLLHVHDDDPRPIYSQLAAQVKEQIRKGSLRPGDELPSVRDVASALGINLHTAHRAYQVLRDEGVILLRLGRRPRVAAMREQVAGREEVRRRLAGRLDELITEAFHLGLSPRAFRSLVDELLRSGTAKR